MENDSNYQQMWKKVEDIISQEREKLYQKAGEMMDNAYARVAEILVKEEKKEHIIDFDRSHIGIPSRTFYNLYMCQSTGRLKQLLEGDYRVSYILEFANVRKLNLDLFRQRYPKGFTPWKRTDDAALERMWCEGRSVEEMATHFQRNIGAINARIEKLELNEKYAPQLKVPQAFESAAEKDNVD